MFKDYYGVLGISPDATTEEIHVAIEKHNGKLSNLLIDEIQMVFRNKSLKSQYDAEYIIYSKSDSKQSYKIVDHGLERELLKIETYVEGRARESIEKSENGERSSGFSWRWVILVLLISLVAKCVSSYNRGKALERFRQSELYNPAQQSGSNAKFFYQTNKLA